MMFTSFYHDIKKSERYDDCLNPLMHNVPKWSDTLQKSCSKCCKIFKVRLTILEHYALKS